jgi:hypothetical protein
LWKQYGGWLTAFHREAYQGVLSMARTKKGKFEPDFEPLIQAMGWDWLIQQLGVERIINHLGVERVVRRLGAKQIYEALTPRQRQQVKRLLQKTGSPPETA